MTGPEPPFHFCLSLLDRSGATVTWADLGTIDVPPDGDVMNGARPQDYRAMADALESFVVTLRLQAEKQERAG